MELRKIQHARSRNTSRRGFFCALAIAVALVNVPTPGIAADTVWGFKGTISSYASGGGFVTISDLPVGSVVRGQFRFDDTTADLDGGANTGSYAFIATALGFEGTSMLHLGVTTTGTLEIENDVVDGADFRDSVGLQSFSGPLVSTLDLTIINLDLTLSAVDNPAPTVITSDALPSSPPALLDFITQTNLQVIGYVGGAMDVTDFTVGITEFEEPGTIDLPVIPDSVTVNGDGSVTWTFDTLGVSLCATGCWIDPPVSTSFTYTMTNSARFTGIADFPTGFTSDFNVSVGGSSIGTFGPGDSLDLTLYGVGGVTEFVVSGIDPATDTSSAEAFPLELTFDSAAAEFTMTSSPAPGVPSSNGPGLVLTVALLAAAGIAARRVRRQP